MAAQTRRVETGIALLALTWGFELACDDGTELGGGDRPLSYFDSTMVMPPGRVDLDLGPSPELDPGWAFHLHGELDTHSGSGTLEEIWPVFTEDLRAQLCRSGELTWEL